MSKSDPLEKICPLCGADNNCAVAAGGDHKSCWCWDATLDQQALATIPTASRNKHCICAACGRVSQDSADER